MTPPTRLGPIRQTAFVVADFEATVREWAEVHGVGPWFLYQVEEFVDPQGPLTVWGARG
jgi:hypothetical protein